MSLFFKQRKYHIYRYQVVSKGPIPTNMSQWCLTSRAHFFASYNIWCLLYGSSLFFKRRKIFGNNFGQECLKLFYELFQIGRENPWFPDFVVYWVDDHFEMAYIETNIESESDLGFDIHVSKWGAHDHRLAPIATTRTNSYRANFKLNFDNADFQF